MTVKGEYEPSTIEWVRDQVARIEAAGDTGAVDINGLPVVMMTMAGNKSGKVRKVPVMAIEHDGVYAAVASKGGAPTNPAWYRNLVANPDIDLQVGTETTQRRARQPAGDERAEWWERAVAAFPPYAEYQDKTDREIPLFVLEPR